MRWFVPLGVALALGACGGSARSGDEAAVAKVAESYYAALAGGDWSAACAARAPTERDELARGGRPCERVLEDLAAGRPDADQFFTVVEIGAVQVAGDRARADVVHPSQPERMTELTAVRENRAWFLKHALGLPPR